MENNYANARRPVSPISLRYSTISTGFSLSRLESHLSVRAVAEWFVVGLPATTQGRFAGGVGGCAIRRTNRKRPGAKNGSIGGKFYLERFRKRSVRR